MIQDIYTNGYRVEALDLLSLTSALCGILVILIKNPVVSVLFLIGLFLCIAGYLGVLGLNFIGLVYLLVYVGAVSILFLFILMLINVRVSELTSNTSMSIPLGLIVCITVSYPLHEVLPLPYSPVADFFSTFWTFNVKPTFFNHTPGDMDYLNNFFNLKGLELDNSREIYYVTSKTWDGNLAESSHITSIGNIMYTSHSMWLILTSLILVLAMVGAIVITIKQTK